MKAPSLVSRSFLIFVVLAVVTLALTLVGARSSTPSNGSEQVQFVREMIQHHSQAVDMAVRIRDRSKDTELRTVALDMLLSQQDQVGQMRGWLTQWNVPWSGPGMTSEHARGMGMASTGDVTSLSTLPVQEAEVKFLHLMIRHHEGALKMVQPMLNDRRTEVRDLARAIKAAQEGEINLMHDFLKARGADESTTTTEPDSQDTMPGMNHSH